jgi:hypothetical protein
MKRPWLRSVPEEKQKRHGLHGFLKNCIHKIRGVFLVILLSAGAQSAVAEAPNSQLTTILERVIKDPAYTLSPQRANKLIRMFKNLFSKDFDIRWRALAELERYLTVVQGIKLEKLSNPEKIALESLRQVLKEKPIQDVHYFHAFFLFGELALPTAENIALFLEHAESDEYSKDFLPQARALSFLFHMPGVGTPQRMSGDDLLALAQDKKYGALFRWAFWDNDGGNLDWIRQDLREAMVQAKHQGNLKEDEAFAIAKVVFARRPAMLAEWLPFKTGDGCFEFFKAFVQADVFGDPEKFSSRTEAIAHEARTFFDHPDRRAEEPWPGPLLAEDNRSSAFLMIFDLMSAFLSQKKLGLLEQMQFEQQVFEILAFSRVKQEESLLTANARSDYTFDRSFFTKRQLTGKDFYLVMTHELGHGVLRLRQDERYFEGWAAEYLKWNIDQITIGELFADVFAILQGPELGITLQESAEHLGSFSNVNYQTIGKTPEGAHIKARQFEKKLLSRITRGEDLTKALKFMLQKYSAAVQKFRKNGSRDGKYLPRWEKFSAAVLRVQP